MTGAVLTCMPAAGDLLDLSLHPEWRPGSDHGFDPAFPLSDLRLQPRFDPGKTPSRTVCEIRSDGDQVHLHPTEPRFALPALRRFRSYQRNRPQLWADLLDRMCLDPDATNAALEQLAVHARTNVLEHRLTVGVVVPGVSYDPQPRLAVTHTDEGDHLLAVIRGAGDRFTVQLTSHADASQAQDALASYLHGRTHLNGTYGLEQMLAEMAMSQAEYTQLVREFAAAS